MYRLILWGLGQRYRRLEHVLHEKPFCEQAEIVGTIGRARGGGHLLSCTRQDEACVV